MKAKLVTEAIKHLKPRSKEEIDKITREMLKIDEVTQTMSKEHKGTLFCLYQFHGIDSTTSDYHTDPQIVLKQYKEITHDFITDYKKYHGEETVYIAIYKIIAGIYGRFIDDNYGMKGTGSVEVLFQISLDTEDL